MVPMVFRVDTICTLPSSSSCCEFGMLVILVAMGRYSSMNSITHRLKGHEVGRQYPIIHGIVKKSFNDIEHKVYFFGKMSPTMNNVYICAYCRPSLSMDGKPLFNELFPYLDTVGNTRGTSTHWVPIGCSNS